MYFSCYCIIQFPYSLNIINQCGLCDKSQWTSGYEVTQFWEIHNSNYRLCNMSEIQEYWNESLRGK